MVISEISFGYLTNLLYDSSIKVMDSIFGAEPIEKKATREANFEEIFKEKINLEKLSAVSQEDIKAICVILQRSKDTERIIKQLYVYQSNMDKSFDEIREEFVSLFPRNIKLKRDHENLAGEEKLFFLREVFDALDEGIQAALNSAADEGHSSANKALFNRQNLDRKYENREINYKMEQLFGKLDKIDENMEVYKKHLYMPNKYENSNKCKEFDVLVLCDKEYEDTSIDYEMLYKVLQILHSDRTDGGSVNVSDGFSLLITRIEALLTKGHNTHKLQKLLGQTYHEYAISLQNNNNSHFQAKLMLLHACTLRCKLNDPDYIFSLFQLFMNAYQASEKYNWEIDDLAPNGWRKWMFHEMGKYSKILRDTCGEMPYSTNLHNLGFLYQFLAKSSIENSICEGHVNSALKYYSEALEIRVRLQNMRLSSQTAFRICQTYSILIKCLKNEINERYYYQILEYINYVEQYYERFPQENFRYSDLVQLKEELYKYYPCSSLKKSAD